MRERRLAAGGVLDIIAGRRRKPPVVEGSAPSCELIIRAAYGSFPQTIVSAGFSAGNALEHGATLRAKRREVIDKLSFECAKPLVAMRARAFFSPKAQFSWLLNLGRSSRQTLLSFGLCDGRVQWACSDDAGGALCRGWMTSTGCRSM